MKIKKQNKKDLEKHLSFSKWIDYFKNELTSSTLDKESFKITVNNRHYEPLMGA